MIVFRLCKAVYSHDLSGCGAEKCGGRWNSKGIAMIYTSQSRALCTAEIAVHVPLGLVPKDYELVTIEIPDTIKLHKIQESQLPADWRLYPPPYSTQRIGDEFIKTSNFLIMKVPSAVVKGDFNYLINPYHKDLEKVKIIKTEPFEFDIRLFVR